MSDATDMHTLRICRLAIFAVLIVTSACTATSGSTATATVTPAPPALTPTPQPDTQDALKELAFLVKNTTACSIYVIHADGSNLRQIAGDVACQRSALPFAWSPAGQSVAYLGGERAQLSLRIILNVDQGTPQTLSLPEQEWVLRTTPVWSPDSQRLLFAARHNGREDVYAWTLNKPLPTNLTDAVPGASFDPLPSPNGEHIAFFVYPKLESRELPQCLDGCSGNLFLMNADGSGIHKVTQFDILSSSENSFAECLPAWSGTGRYLAFEVGCNVNVAENLYVLDTENGMLTKATVTETTPLPLIAPLGFLTSDEIVYSQTNLGSETAQTLYLADIKGGPARPFLDWQNSPTESSIDDISWTEDGLWIVGLVNTQDNQTEIAIGNRETNNLVLTGVKGWSPRWSPAGDLIAYLATPTGQVGIMSRDGSEVREVTPELESTPFALAWSP